MLLCKSRDQPPLFELDLRRCPNAAAQYLMSSMELQAVLLDFPGARNQRPNAGF
jgi:hypothetical protein